jgi:hypothetical protein
MPKLAELQVPTERSRITFRFDGSAPEITPLVSASDEDERQ